MRNCSVHGRSPTFHASPTSKEGTCPHCDDCLEDCKEFHSLPAGTRVGEEQLHSSAVCTLRCQAAVGLGRLVTLEPGGGNAATLLHASCPNLAQVLQSWAS